MKPQKKRWLSMLLVLALAAGGLGGGLGPAAYAAEMDEVENGGATEDNEGRNTEEEPGGGVPGTEPDDGNGDGVPGTDPDDGDGDGVPGIDPDDGDGDGVPGTDPDDENGDDAPGTDPEDEDDSENEEEEADDEETTDEEDEEPDIPEEGVPVAQLLAEGVLLQMGVFGAPPSPVDGLWPDSGSVDVDVDAPLVITFSDSITFEPGKSITIRESDGTGFITIRTDNITISGSGENIVIINHPGLKPNTTYYVEIDGGAFTAGGIPISGFSGKGIWYFTTGSLKDLSGGNNNIVGVGASSDNDDASTLPTDVNITIRYETEDGTSLGSQRITTERGSILSPEDLDLPDGYRLKDPNWRYKADFSGSLAVILEPVPEEPALEQGEPGEPPLILLVDMPHYIDRDTGEVMVALRPMAEAAGVDSNNIQWNEAEQRVTVTYPETGITMDFIAGETITRITYPTVQPYPGGEANRAEGEKAVEDMFISADDWGKTVSLSEDAEETWYYFYSTENSSKDSTKTIDGKKYVISEDGGWVESEEKYMVSQSGSPDAEDAEEPGGDTEPNGDTAPKIIINEAESKAEKNVVHGEGFNSTGDMVKLDTDYSDHYVFDKNTEKFINTPIGISDTVSEGTDSEENAGANNGEPAGDTEPEIIINEAEYAVDGGSMNLHKERNYQNYYDRLGNLSSEDAEDAEYPEIDTIYHLETTSTQNQPNNGADAGEPAGDTEPNAEPAGVSSGGGAYDVQTSVVLGDGTVLLFVSSQAGPREVKPAAITIPNGAAPATDSVGYGGVEEYIVYEDLSGYGWAEGYISYAQGEGIVSGYGDGTFQPGNTVSYDEAATMLVESLGYTSNSETQPAGVPGSAEGEPLTVSQNDPPETETEMSDGGFVDVSGIWEYGSDDDVVKGVAESLFGGTSTDFDPDDTGMTRGMFITILDDPEKEYIEFVVELPVAPENKDDMIYVPIRYIYWGLL